MPENQRRRGEPREGRRELGFNELVHCDSLGFVEAQVIPGTGNASNTGNTT